MMSKGNYSLSKNQRRGNIVSYAVLIIGALLVILPILWMFITALKDDLEIYQMNGRILPEQLQPHLLYESGKIMILYCTSETV